jgi:hypothetical protein
MKNSILALKPEIVVAQGEPELHSAPKGELWNQEQEVHNRVPNERPETAREQLQRLVPGMDYKRMIL